MFTVSEQLMRLALLPCSMSSKELICLTLKVVAMFGVEWIIRFRGPLLTIKMFTLNVTSTLIVWVAIGPCKRLTTLRTNEWTSARW